MLIEIVRDENDSRLPPAGRTALKALADQIEALTERVDSLEREIVAEVRRNAAMRRLATIPGVGPIAAATIQALAPDPGVFTSGRHFAAWIGLSPKNACEWWERALGENLQDRESDAALSSRRGRNGGAAACPPRRHAVALADGFFVTQASQSGSHRVSEQDGQDHLGAAHQRWNIHPKERRRRACGSQTRIWFDELAGVTAAGQSKVHSINDDPTGRHPGRTEAVIP
jgi:hypothetical protein